MTDKPIIFSGPMVRALLEGRKTQTRRIVKGVPDAPAMDNIAWPDKKLHPAPYLDAYCGAQRTSKNPRGMTANWAYWTRDDRPGPLFKVGCVPGDRLWVRETWRPALSANDPWHVAVVYQADGNVKHWNWSSDADFGDWNIPKQAANGNVPSIHMPRWASRLTLTVTDVRVQRVQDISEEDAIAEGAPMKWMPGRDDRPFAHLGGETWATADYWFRTLWDGLNAKRGFGWDENPWVVALTFSVHKGNIDAMEADQ